MQSIRFNPVTLLFLSCIISASLVAAQNSTNGTDEDSSPFSEDFANNVFTDLGPSVHSHSSLIYIEADEPGLSRYSAKSLRIST